MKLLAVSVTHDLPQQNVRVYHLLRELERQGKADVIRVRLPYLVFAALAKIPLLKRALYWWLLRPHQDIHRTLLAFCEPVAAQEWKGPSLLDWDDPWYTRREVEKLNACARTDVILPSTRAWQLMRAAGLKRSVYITPNAAAVWKKRFRVGYAAPFLRLDGPRAYALRSFLGVMARAARVIPGFTFILVGEADAALKDFCAGKKWIRLKGFMQQEDLLEEIDTWHASVYPRKKGDVPDGRTSIKISQCIAADVPVVGYDTYEMFPVRLTGCGRIARDDAEVVLELKKIQEMEASRTWNGPRILRAERGFWDVLIRKVGWAK